jgi:phosphoserine phosphatase
MAPLTISGCKKQPCWIKAIVEARPLVAAFDCDGTLWSVDSGLGFFNWELERSIVGPAAAATARSMYSDYLSGSVAEDAINGHFATMHEGIPVNAIRAAAEEYVMTDVRGTLFDEMIRLVGQLRALGCDVWLVSSTNQWVIEAAAALVGLTADRVLATAAAVVDGVINNRLDRVPTGPGKRRALEGAVRAAPDAAFGNSRWDVEMLTYARQAFAVHPSPELARIAEELGWPILHPK